MYFTSYCLVLLGDVSGGKEDVKRIAESQVNFLEANGLVIATFYSAVNIKELTNYFKLNKRNFLIFNMDDNNYGAFLKDENINYKLFESFKNDLNNKTALISEEIEKYNESLYATSKSGSTTSHKLKLNQESIDDTTISYLSGLSFNEKMVLIDELLDKGDGLTEIDKKYIEILSKR